MLENSQCGSMGSEIVRRRIVGGSWIFLKPSREWPERTPGETGEGDKLGFLETGDVDEKSSLRLMEPLLFSEIWWWLVMGSWWVMVVRKVVLSS